MKDSLEDILEDLDEVFCFDPDATYQSRAHDYLNRYEVPRTFNDTAVQRVVHHLVSRAASLSYPDTDLKGLMVEEATRLLELARDMEG